MFIFKNILFELGVILTILIVGYLIDAEEVVLLIKYDDAGSIIASVGILWCIGVLFRIRVPWDAKFSSWACAIGLFIFGHALTEYGLYYAICAIGCYLLLAGYILHAIMDTSLILIPLFLIGIILAVFGYNHREASVPTKLDPALRNRAVDISVEWQIVLLYDNGCSMANRYFTVTGTQKEAVNEAEQIKYQFIKKYPHKYLAKTKILCLKVPKWYERKYGWPLDITLE